MLPVFFDQHVRRWEGTKDPSPFVDRAYRKWYRALAHTANAAGWLHFSALQCGTTTIAFHFGFCHGSTLSWYKPCFNPDFARESPGTALISCLIEDAVGRNLQEFDFTGGLEPFKMRFSNAQRECVNLRIFSRPWLHAAFAAGGRLRHFARDHWHRIRTANARLPRQD
jgi:CelD/BcsL family acetyltransferase involved in cellulose biosynthesis